MHSSRFFWIKPIAKLILKGKNSGSHTISDQSLLLSTIVLNDYKSDDESIQIATYKYTFYCLLSQYMLHLQSTLH